MFFMIKNEYKQAICIFYKYEVLIRSVWVLAFIYHSISKEKNNMVKMIDCKRCSKGRKMWL